jgi:hypothetical protein
VLQLTPNSQAGGWPVNAQTSDVIQMKKRPAITVRPVSWREKKGLGKLRAVATESLRNNLGITVWISGILDFLLFRM